MKWCYHVSRWYMWCCICKMCMHEPQKNAINLTIDAGKIIAMNSIYPYDTWHLYHILFKIHLVFSNRNQHRLLMHFQHWTCYLGNIFDHQTPPILLESHDVCKYTVGEKLKSMNWLSLHCLCACTAPSRDIAQKTVFYLSNATWIDCLVIYLRFAE